MPTLSESCKVGLIKSRKKKCLYREMTALSWQQIKIMLGCQFLDYINWECNYFLVTEIYQINADAYFLVKKKCLRCQNVKVYTFVYLCKNVNLCKSAYLCKSVYLCQSAYLCKRIYLCQSADLCKRVYLPCHNCRVQRYDLYLLLTG